MICCPINSTQRRYSWRILATLAVYMAFLFLAVWEFTHRHPAGVLAYTLAILPAIPIVGMLVAHGLYLAEEKDEFLRSIAVQSMLWSLGAVLAATTVWGFLEDFVHVPHVPLLMVFPIYCAFHVIFARLLHWRYK
ncbi:MAG: hypothetical protein ACRD3N_00670 [Terracidiphilus sp.]